MFSLVNLHNYLLHLRFSHNSVTPLVRKYEYSIILRLNYLQKSGSTFLAA